MKTLNEIREERQANAARVAELAEKKKELDELRNAFNKAGDAVAVWDGEKEAFEVLQ